MMYSKFPPDSSSSNDTLHQSTEIDSEVDSIAPEPLTPCSATRLSDHTLTSSCSKSDDDDASVVQMALLQLMTRRVMEATASSPDTIKLMNAAIRRDRKNVDC